MNNFGVLLVLLLSTPLFAQGTGAQTLSYEAFVDLVAKQHPETEISDKRFAIAKGAIERSGVLPDPQLTIGRDQVSLPGRYQRNRKDSMMPDAGEPSESAARWQVGLSQSLPWPGTLAAESRAAEAQKDVVTTDLGRAKLERRFAATELFLRMVRISKLIEIQKSNLKVVEGVKNFAHAKFKQGIGSHMEFLQTHSESGVLKANLAALETDLRNLKRHAIALINDPAIADPAILQFDLEWPRSFTTADSPSDLVQQRLAREKDVLVARNDAAYRRSLPSVMASSMLMQEDDSDMRMYGVMLGVSVPVYSIGLRRSLSRESSLAQARIESELTWHDKQKALALSQAQDRIAQIEANVLALRDEIIPPVKEHIEAAAIQFSQGKADIGAIIEGRRTLLNLQVTEVMTSEALALANLSVAKTQAGLVDMELDQEVPQIAGPNGGNMGSGMSGSSTMSDMAKPSTRSSTKGNAKGTTRAPSAEGDETQNAPSGMGM